MIPYRYRSDGLRPTVQLKQNKINYIMKGRFTMIEIIDKIYQSRPLDSVTPVTKRAFEEEKAKSDIHIAELMIHVRSLAQQVGAELPEAEELDALVEQVVLEQRKEITIEREMQTFFKREQQYADGAWGERMKRLVGKNNVNPYHKYGEDVFNRNNPYPQNKSGNDETILQMMSTMQQQQANMQQQATQQAQIFNEMLNMFKENKTSSGVVEQAEENKQ